MEKREIDIHEKKRVQKLTFRVIIAFSVVILAYVAYALISKNLNIILFEILLGAFVVTYTLMTDIAEPYRLGIFKDMTELQRSALLKILGLDVVGVAAILYWIAGISSDDTSSMLIPLLIYFVAARAKGRFRPELEGVVEEAEEEAPELEAEPEALGAEEVSDLEAEPEILEAEETQELEAEEAPKALKVEEAPKPEAE